MRIILDDVVIVSALMLALGLLQAPVGYVFMRMLGWPPRWSVAIGVGALVTPLAWFLLGALGLRASLWRWGFWLLMTVGALWLLYQRYPHDSARPPIRAPRAWLRDAWQRIGLSRRQQGTLAHEDPNSLYRTPRLLYLVAFFAAITALAPIILQGNNDRGLVYIAHLGDWYKHIQVTSALSHSDAIPVENPFLSTAEHLRYYIFFYLPPAMISRLFSASVAHAAFAQTALLAAFFPIFVYYIARLMGMPRRAGVYAAILLTLTGGYDILYLIYEAKGAALGTHVDGWVSHAQRRINAPHTMLLWTPQHILGLMGFLLVLTVHAPFSPKAFSTDDGTWRSYWPAILFTGVIVAALAGTSSYVWFGTGLALALLTTYYFVVQLFQVRRGTAWRRFIILFLGLGLSLLLSLPYLKSISGLGGTPIIIEISPTRPGDIYGGFFSERWGPSQRNYALDFPFQMIPEFGAVLMIGLIGWWQWRKEGGSRQIWLQWGALTLVFMLVVLGVRSDDYRSNNFAARVAPMAWAMLALMGGWWWSQRHARGKGLPLLFYPLLLIGFVTIIAEPSLQSYRSYGYMVSYGDLIPRYWTRVTADEAEVFEWINANTPEDSIIQFGFDNYGAGFLSERNMAFAERYHGGLFATLSEYELGKGAIEAAYASEDPARAAALFDNVGVRYVVHSIHNMYRADLASFNKPRFDAYFRQVYANPGYYVFAVMPPAPVVNWTELVRRFDYAENSFERKSLESLP